MNMTKEQLWSIKKLWCDWVQCAVDLGPNSNRAIDASNKFVDSDVDVITLCDEIERLQHAIDVAQEWLNELEELTPCPICQGPLRDGSEHEIDCKISLAKQSVQYALEEA